MSEDFEKNDEVIRLFIVDEDGQEIEVDQNNFNYNIKLEITNSEDQYFGLEESEYVDLTTNNEISQEDALLLDNIKIEVIDDPEAEFGEFYQNEFQDEEHALEELFQDSENENADLEGSPRPKRRRRGRPSLAVLNGTNNRKLHTCNVCGYTSHQKSHYRRHLTIHFKPDGIRCSICRKTMLAKAELTDHMEEHRCPEDRNRFQCNMCSYTSNKLTNVSQHTEVHYKPKREKLQCERCSFATTNKVRYRHHVAMHMSTKRNMKCPVCLMVFKSMSLRRRHIQRYKSPDDPNRFQCPECSYSTIKFNNFKQHMVVHRSEFEIEMFQCPYCPFRSKRKTDLRQHVIVKHKTDDEVQLFQCDFCSYVSRRGNHLTSHMKNRHRRDLVLKKCGLCSYKTVSQILIEKHFGIHSKIPDRFFLCSHCGFGCQSQMLLDKHMALKHQDPNEIVDEIDELTYGLRKSNEIKKEPESEKELGYSFELVKVKQEKIEVEDDEDVTEEEDVEMTVYCCQFAQCNFVAGVERDAKIHMTICHNKRGDDNRCPECTFHTTSRYLYLDHLKVHKIDIEHLKPHLCDICGTRWIRQGDLTRHMSVHWGGDVEKRKRVPAREETSNKKLLCCNICNYTTRIRLCLYKHMLRHGKELQMNFNSYVGDEMTDDGESE